MHTALSQAVHAEHARRHLEPSLVHRRPAGRATCGAALLVIRGAQVMRSALPLSTEESAPRALDGELLDDRERIAGLHLHEQPLIRRG